MTTPEEDPALAAALRALRVEYLAAGPERVAELWRALDRVQNGDADALPDLRVLVHRLAGTGGGYGVPEVTIAARVADECCRALIVAGAPPGAADVTQLRVLITGVADAFERATNME